MRFSWYMLALLLLLPLLLPPTLLLLLLPLYSVSHSAARTGCCEGELLPDRFDSASRHHWNLQQQ